MKYKASRFTVVVALCAAFVVPAAADWDTGDPFKWRQMPDLNQTGIDIRATTNYVLADDFQCDVTGPLTNVHVWGSWYHDLLPLGNPGKVTFTLSIHKDVPAGTGGIPYSRPGAVIWSRTYEPGSFTTRLYRDGLYEGWLNPPSAYESFGDTKCYQYNFAIPSGAVRQTGTPGTPKVYWLAVQAIPQETGKFFGWKTSPNHWNDAATWAQGAAPYEGSWNKLTYPPGHPYYGSNIDLAFVVNGGPDKDWGDAPDSVAAPGYPTLAAHNGARHTILAGLHMGAAVDYETDGQPDSTAAGDDSAGIDDEDGVRIPILAPGAAVTVEVDVELDSYSKRAYVDAWLDCNQDKDWDDAGEHVLVSRDVVEGENELSFTVPAATLTGTTFSRFRLSLDGGLSPTGEAQDGEVEDYQVTVAAPYDYGDAPEGVLCYLSGAIGGFPTCTACGPGGFIRHKPGDAWLGPMVDAEGDGNAGACLMFDWGDYDQDECADDGDAGIIMPFVWTLTGVWASNVCNWPNSNFGAPCEVAEWGKNIDVSVHNWLPGHTPYAEAYVNVLVDWNHDGVWAGSSECALGPAPEHVLIDFPIPAKYDGLLSALGPPSFLIGPEAGHAWARISITERPVGVGDWDGSGDFDAGETEDYLVNVVHRDYGDAPAPYPTRKDDHGASHYLSGDIKLGAARDADFDGQPDPDALGDDNDGLDDEDGVSFVTSLVPGATAQVDVTATGVSALSCLDAWIDFNRDGDWADPGEHALDCVTPTEGTNHCIINVPHDAEPGETFARFRLSWTAAGLSYDGPGDAGEVEDYKVTISSGVGRGDLGDAPDSSNSHGTPMTAYPRGGPPGVAAGFPTVYHAGSPPYGPIHLEPDTAAYLGAPTVHSVTLEDEADVGYDQDMIQNIYPPADHSDTDFGDDGLSGILLLPHCQPTTFQFGVWVNSLPAGTRLYANAWFDWNRDGDWNDTLACPGAPAAPEWAVRDYEVTPGAPGTYSFTTPQFVSWHPGGAAGQPIWMRLTLSEQKWPGVEGGCGPEGGYVYGETEDYYFTPASGGPTDYGDAPDPTYPTLFLSNGAAHTIVSGIRLGANIDAEPDGQPEANALGDDAAGVDDEDGIVFLTPLVQGQTARIKVTASITGKLDAWVDFSDDGDWADAGERIYSGLVVPAGSSTQTFTVPADAVAGTTFARFRFSTAGVASYDGYAPDGEVEDYRVPVERLKWLQPPDLSTEGLDANASVTNSPPYVLADDFRCVAAAPITNIHVWGSWKFDVLPKDASGAPDARQVIFKLSIHKDIPAGTGGIPYSRPGSTLAAWTFNPGSFAAWKYAENLSEGWFDPPSAYNPAGDSVCWQYDFGIPSAQWFYQSGTPDHPRTYWLQVQAQPLRETAARFGWKSSTLHWNDAAVWGNGAAPFEGPWNELKYPAGHPRKGLPIDLAFSISSLAQDFGDAPDPYPTLMASNGASHCIVDGWRLGSRVDAESEGQPNATATGDDATGVDDEDGVYMHTPVIPLCRATAGVTASQAGKLDAWIDFNNDGDWNDAGERIANSVALAAGLNYVTFDVPDVPGDCRTFGRFRFSQNGGLPYNGGAPNGEVEDYLVPVHPRPAVVSIGEAKRLPLGALVLLRDKVVTANFVSDLRFYVEEPDRSAGMRVSAMWGPVGYAVGDVLSCCGYTRNPDCEVDLRLEHSWVVSSSSVEPVGQTNRGSGGGPIYQNPPPPDVVNQPAVLDIASGLPAGPVDASGPNSVGLLVKLWGRCTHVTRDLGGNPVHFWIDDGSGLQTTDAAGGPVTGVEVGVPTPAAITIETGSYYSVTGIMSETDHGGGCVRYLRPRTNDDIRAVSP